MKIGVIICFIGYGGVYQYTLSLLEAIEKYKDKKTDDQFILFTNDFSHEKIISLESEGWKVASLYPISKTKQFVKQALKKIIDFQQLDRFLNHFQKELPHPNIPVNPEIINYKPERKKWFKSFGIKLMIYPNANPLSFETGIPYIMAIHDLQHRLQPEFPEVSANGEWEKREYVYRNGSRNATMILSDSKVGKEDIIRCYGKYGVKPKKIQVLPYLPAGYLITRDLLKEKQRISDSFNLPLNYLFYPAQFWPHKNHLRIVRALGLLKKEKELDIPIVFCGLNSGEIRGSTHKKMMLTASRLEIDKNIYYLGYVKDEDMSGLYAGAKALIMPTFFGPTNIPILEAWQFGCPVLTSDIRGIREQVGKAAVLVNPKSISDIANGIYQLWIDQELQQKLIKEGKQRLNSYQFNDFYYRFERILDKTKKLVK